MVHFAGIWGKADKVRGVGSGRFAACRVGLGLLFAGAMVTAGMGQATTTLLMPQGPLLPGQFGSWTASTTDGASAGGDSPLVSGAAAEVLKEDGARRSAHQTYKQAGAASGTVTVDAVQFEDATGAASAYTYLRTNGMREIGASRGVGPQTAREGDRYLFREGTSVVEAEVSGGGSAEDLKRLAATLPKISGPRGLPPLLPTYLPQAGLIPESVHYAVGPVGYQAMGGVLPVGSMGFDKSAEAVTAQYAGRGTLTLLLFPTPQIAGDRGRAVAAGLNTAGAKAGAVTMRREGPMVMVATNGFTPDEAHRLVDGIHLRTELTWNKQMPPEFHTEVRKTASLLVNIAVLSGVLGLAAVLLGLFLGFGRAWVRVLMGKPAAMEPEFLRLDLRGGGTTTPAVPKK